MLAASAAAALILLGAAGYAATTPLTRHAPGTVLTAVGGCTGVELASGTLEQVNGSSLVIKTASGQPVTVTTTASTTVSVAGPLLSDITDGASVIVLGPSSGGTNRGRLRHRRAAARPGQRERRPEGDAATGLGRCPGDGIGREHRWLHRRHVRRNPGSGDHLWQHARRSTRASLGQLQAGTATVAVGHAGPDRTLSAIRVLQQPPGSQFKVQFNVKARGCSPASPASLADALNAALLSGG